MHGYVAKPIGRKDLAEVIARYCAPLSPAGPPAHGFGSESVLQPETAGTI
jgi:hypothetical protein